MEFKSGIRAQSTDAAAKTSLMVLKRSRQRRPGQPASDEVPGAPTKAPMFAWIAWLIYIIGAMRGRWPWGLLGGAIGMLVIIGIEYRHRAIKIVDATSLGFFVMMLAASIALGQWIIADYNVLIVWAIFAFVCWATILMDFPFTLQYLREQAPPAVWHQPVFIRTNYFISLLWAVICTINTMLGFAMLKSAHPLILGAIVPTALMIFAYAAGGWYGKHVLAKLKDRIAAPPTMAG
jgi:hypothetical protein